jgi:stearoyl-CoA desaturase (delta-9 desaturase)
MPDSKELLKKPPILWFQASIFLTTFVFAVTIVPWYGLHHGYSVGLILSAILFLWANGLSITAGYHRLWAHNAYKAHPLLRILLALFGAATLQNSALVWCSGHRRHHRHVDDVDRDPYSAKRGFWFSHMGWMLRDYESAIVDLSNVPDLKRDPIVVWQHKYYGLIAFSMNILPPLLVGWLLDDIIGALLLMGILRLVVSHHTTFFINSLAHLWGKQPYTDTNSARDNVLIALFTYGEGYHNFHHLFQNDYRNGARWWQFDPTKWLIKAGSWIGLTSALSSVPTFKIQHALLAMQLRRVEEELAQGDFPKDGLVTWRTCLDKEYQQLSANLNEWTKIRQQWYSQRRSQINEVRSELSKDMHSRWEQTKLRNRVKELEFMLKMQRKRLNYLSSQFGMTPA